MADFLLAHKKTSASEGGYANVVGDNGGETYAGISRKFWPKWSGWKIVDTYKPLQRNQKINNIVLHDMILDFYKINFWDVLMADEIEDQQTAYKLYDFGVTSGKPQTIKQIQKVLNLPETGKVTKELIDNINNPVLALYNKHK